VNESSMRAPPVDATVSTSERERRGVLRLDEQPDVSRFVGVWLEQPDATRWVVDYRAYSVWSGLVGREVIVTGACYSPLYSSIVGRPHFRIATLRPADPARGVGPYLSIGPERDLRGELVDVAAPAGSKAAGSSRLVFRAEDGAEYNVVADDRPALRGRVEVRGRVLEPDMSYAARATGPDLWIIGVLEPGKHDPLLEIPPTKPCP
jgi:hypothetical protein